MKKIIALSLAFGLLSFGASGAEAKNDGKKSAKKAVAKKTQQTTANNELAAILPKSDAIATFNTKRMFEVAPQLLAQNVKIFAAYNEMLDNMQTTIGIDLRQFENLAFGATYARNAQGKFDLRPMLVARGNMNVGSLVAAGRIAANGKYREQTLGDKTVYIFRLEEIMRDIAEKRAKKASANGTITAEDQAKIEKALKWLKSTNLQEVAVASFDTNTLVFGDLNNVKATFEGAKSATKNAELLTLMNERPNALMRFAGSVPVGTADVFGLENDEIGNTVAMLKQMRGWLDSADGTTAMFIGGRTAQAEQAVRLEEMLGLLKMLGGNLLGNKANAKNQSLKTLVNNLKITRVENEVQLSLSAPTSDIAQILGKF